MIVTCPYQDSGETSLVQPQGVTLGSIPIQVKNLHTYLGVLEILAIKKQDWAFTT